MSVEEKVGREGDEATVGGSERQRDRYCLLRCEDCGYRGHRRFVLRADGEWREILGGDRGITPDMCRCDCGSSRLVCEEVVTGVRVEGLGEGPGGVEPVGSSVGFAAGPR